uniref:Uncharacterized protein n=1 Tax=Anguilla anguilla TaxID=7936 RepID=A0A0E9W0G5_ANGAN
MASLRNGSPGSVVQSWWACTHVGTFRIYPPHVPSAATPVLYCDKLIPFIHKHRKEQKRVG